MIASQALLGMINPVTHRATHYHTTSIDPYWSASLVETTRIGAHVFYRNPTRAERAVMAAARSRARIETEETVDLDATATDMGAPVEAVEAAGAAPEAPSADVDA